MSGAKARKQIQEVGHFLWPVACFCERNVATLSYLPWSDSRVEEPVSSNLRRTPGSLAGSTPDNIQNQISGYCPYLWVCTRSTQQEVVRVRCVHVCWKYSAWCGQVTQKVHKSWPSLLPSPRSYWWFWRQPEPPVSSSCRITLLLVHTLILVFFILFFWQLHASLVVHTLSLSLWTHFGRFSALQGGK